MKHRGRGPERQDRRGQERQQQQPSADILVGRNPLREVLKHAPKRIRKAYILRGEADAEKQALRTALEKAGVRTEEVAREVLDRLASGSSHQGFALELEAPNYIELDQFLNSLKDGPCLLVALDELQDPHNFGAVLRASECFGAAGIIWSKNRGCQLTSTVRKTSVGASELVPLVRVGNLVEALRQLKKAGFICIGADIGEGSESVFDFSFPEKTVLVLGSEGDGLKRLVKETLDYRVHIPMFGAIDSLNVSQAAAILLGLARSKISLSSQ